MNILSFLKNYINNNDSFENYVIIKPMIIIIVIDFVRYAACSSQQSYQ